VVEVVVETLAVVAVVEAWFYIQVLLFAEVQLIL
tara:strand:- start:340 stop:441 length:102 start_codon:yes stop_codon:yes gene_type:complete